MSATDDTIATLHGAELEAALEKAFVMADESVEISGRRYTLRKPANADHLISEADYVMDERLPYWADLWPSSRVLAARLLDDGAPRGTLLEMGCGLGLTTVAAMDAGFEVTATDYYVDALHVTRANAARNVGREPAVRMVNWRDWPDNLGRFDTVVAADVLYEKEYATLVAACLERAMAPGGRAIVADPGRLALPAFLDALGAHGLVVAERERVPYHVDTVKQEVQLLHLTRVPG